MQILLALAALAARAEPVWAPPPLVTFERYPLLYGDRVKVDVELLPPPKAGPRQYAFKRVFVGPNGEDEGQPYYTDTIYCPQALRSLQQLTNLPGPQPGMEGLEKGPAEGSLRDGVVYRLSVATTPPYSFGDMTLRSNTGTPLARWVNETLKTLKPCWRPTQLKL